MVLSIEKEFWETSIFALDRVWQQGEVSIKGGKVRGAGIIVEIILTKKSVATTIKGIAITTTLTTPTLLISVINIATVGDIEEANKVGTVTTLPVQNIKTPIIACLKETLWTKSILNWQWQ